MELKKIEKSTVGIKFFAQENEKEIGRASLYLIYNDLHKEPYGLLEDVFVEESERGRGTGGRLVNKIIEEAKKRGCYKLVATSRSGRKEIHEWYKRLGFKEYGSAFRMNF